MPQRGRKSTAAQNLPRLTVVDVSQEKPDPPEHLTPEQKGVWREIVASMKPGSFYASTFPLLASYCSHVTWARFVEAELHKCSFDSDPKKFRSLLSMHNRQSATLSMLATKLRLLPRTNTRAVRQETDASGRPWDITRRRPWDDDIEPSPAA